MTPREWIFAVMQGKPVDRRPIGLGLSPHRAKLTACPLARCCRDPAAHARGQAAVLETFRPNVLFAPSALPLEAVASGSEVRYFDNPAPSVMKPAISPADQIDRLPVPEMVGSIISRGPVSSSAGAMIS